jgi:hypothetical protein
VIAADGTMIRPAVDTATQSRISGGDFRTTRGSRILPGTHPVWLVDESTMISEATKKAFVEKACELGSKVIFLGDFSPKTSMSYQLDGLNGVMAEWVGYHIGSVPGSRRSACASLNKLLNSLRTAIDNHMYITEFWPDFCRLMRSADLSLVTRKTAVSRFDPATTDVIVGTKKCRTNVSKTPGEVVICGATCAEGCKCQESTSGVVRWSKALYNGKGPNVWRCAGGVAGGAMGERRVSTERPSDSFIHAPALTAHSFQGQTVEGVLIIDASRFWTIQQLYVAVSRVRKALQLIVLDEAPIENR